jgi:hypothetical protein
VGTNDSLGCAQYASERCYWLGSNEVDMPYCAGDPLGPCSSFSTKDDGGGDQVSPPSESNIQGSYSGTATATVQYYDYDVYADQHYFVNEVTNQFPNWAFRLTLRLVLTVL